MRQIGNDRLADRIGHLHKHNRGCRSLLLQDCNCWSCVGEDDIGFKTNQLCGIGFEAFKAAARPANIDPGIAPLDPAAAN
jgi:hypothetical protein